MTPMRLAVVLCFVLAVSGSRQVAADEIEDFFSARGPYDTTSDLSTGPANDFSLFTPAEPGANGELHAVITWGNGTFAIPLFYFDFLDHLASHGFVVIASNSGFVGSGEQMLEGVDWILEQNDDPTSFLFQTINVEAIGATGHSQGGGGTINAGNDPRIICTAPIQPVPGVVEGLNGPMFALAGENDTIVPAEGIWQGIYLPASVPSIFGGLRGATHFEPLGSAGRYRGYITAWFAACLEADSFARGAFVGDCSICQNSDWVVVRKEG